MPLASKKTAPFKFRIGKSATGKGLYAEEAIPKGARIIEYTGKPISEKLATESGRRYLFTVGKHKTIDGNIPSNIARYINHSCAPNAEARGWRDRIFIYAIKRIKPGDEITYDYGDDYFEGYIKPKGCRCAKCAPALHAAKNA